MSYQKSTYDNRAIADFSRAAIDNIENGLRLGYHAVTIANCVQHLQLYGGVSAALWPFFENRLDRAQDIGNNGVHFFTSLGAAQDLHLWDTPPQNQGIMRAYTFNGTDEYMVAADSAFFTVLAASKFSIGAWINMKDSTSSTILSKWDITTAAEKREWLFYLDGSDYLGLLVYDETNNAGIGRQYTTAVTQNIWHFVAATYDGGTDAANIKVYLDGARVDNGDIVDDVGFATMVNTDTPVRCGSLENAAGAEADLFDGKMALPFFMLDELGAFGIWNLYQLGKAALDLDLSAGMPD